MDEALILNRVTHHEFKITGPAYLAVVTRWDRSQPEIYAFILTLLAHVVGGSKADPTHWCDSCSEG